MPSARRWWSIAGAPGARERQSGLLLHHQARTVDTQLAVFREITCDQAVLTDPATAPAEIARVLRSARGALAAGLYRIPARHGGRRDCGRCRCCRAARADRGGARRMRRRNPGAAGQRPSRPAIIVDVEIRRYGIEERVAEARAQARPAGGDHLHGARPARQTRPTWSPAPISGRPATRPITRLVEDADALLLLGVILSDTNFALSQRKLDPRRTMLAIDRRCASGTTSIRTCRSTLWSMR